MSEKPSGGALRFEECRIAGILAVFVRFRGFGEGGCDGKCWMRSEER